MQLLVVITCINHVTVELKGFVLHIPTFVGQINPDNTVNDATQPSQLSSDYTLADLPECYLHFVVPKKKG